MEEADAFAEKAAESLASAGDDFAQGRHNSCSRNSYYAAFQAAVAALLLEGIRPARRWDHEFVHSEFQGRLVYRRKLYSSRYRTLLTDAFRVRVDADYSARFVSRRSALEILRGVRGLLGEIKEKNHGGR
ncbi:MAG: HEPN domain-containing protein [Dehalococcoidia bacterium]|nr:HEPN domain-containing protein [Dehalococcoidia bacterium]